MNDKKNLLRKETWGKKLSYYQGTTNSYKNIQNHYGYQLFSSYLRRANILIEFGCGNGSVIGNILKYHRHLIAYGVDFSALAIRQAKKLYTRNVHFQVGDAETVTFPVKADITMSFFTFEHLDKPEKVLANMIQHTKKGGYIAIVCPNYGSPIYPSPCYGRGWKKRLSEGITRDIHLLFSRGERTLLWEKVDPIIDPGAQHLMDHDTTVEPYIYALRKYVTGNYPNISVITASSGWSTAWFGHASVKFILTTLPLRILSILHISPFQYWGPRCLLLLRKDTL